MITERKVSMLLTLLLSTLGATGCSGEPLEAEEVAEVGDHAKAEYALHEALGLFAWLGKNMERPCLSPVVIQSAKNGKYVSARLDLADRSIRADADAANDWERFEVCREPDGTVSFFSLAARRYMTAMQHETFHDPAGEIVFQPGGIGIITEWANVHIAQRYGRVRAFAKNVLDWERYVVEPAGDNSVALRALSTDKYVRVMMNDKYFPLYANSNSVGSSAKFR